MLPDSLSCLEVPHVCRGTPGLLIIALPADFRASIPKGASDLRQVDSPVSESGPRGGVLGGREVQYSRRGSTERDAPNKGETREREKAKERAS